MRSFWIALSVVPGLAGATVHYTIAPDPAELDLKVSITVDAPQAVEKFQIPWWCPGLYAKQPYAEKISTVRAVDKDGHALNVSHPDRLTWQVAAGGKPFTMSYRVLGDDPGLGFFGVSVKSNSAFENGAGALMYGLNRKTEDATLEVSVPSGWDVLTALPSDGPGRFHAGDYDELIDSPVQMGVMLKRTFTSAGIPFIVAWVAQPDEKVAANLDAEVEDLKKVTATGIQLMGKAGFNQYVFIYHRSLGGFLGGLEHRASTVIAMPNEAKIQDLPDLSAHEFYHAWNVKQIRPVLLGPFDYTKPQRTGNLWFAEGVTDYYAKLITYRSRAERPAWLFSALSDQVFSLQTGTMRKSHTVERASSSAWENGGFNDGDLDYYNKGLLAGWIFDAFIRDATNGKKSLDDVMRTMFDQYRLPKPGYPEDGVMEAISKVAGQDASALYKKMIRSTDEMPYEELRKIGLRILGPGQTVAYAGFEVMDGGVHNVEAYAQKAGLRAGDQFIEFAPCEEASKISVRVLRDGQEKVVTYAPGTVRPTSWKLELDPMPTPKAAARLKEWLALP